MKEINGFIDRGKVQHLMSVTKFQNEDMASQLVDLDAMQAKLENSLAEDKKSPEMKSSDNAFVSAFVVEALMSVIAPVPVAAGLTALTMALAESRDNKRGKNGPRKPVRSNFFVSDAISTQQKQQQQQRATPVSMIPAKAGDRKMIAKMTGKPALDVGAVKIAEMSLRGSSLTGAEPKPASGMKIVHKKPSLETSENPETRQALNLVYSAKNGQLSLARIADGLNKGHENAEQAVKRLGNTNETSIRLKQMGMS